MKFVRKTTYYTGVVYEWNLPTGWTCPFADACLVKVDKNTGKFKNESHQYRCYAANAERFPGVRDHRWKNFEYVKAGNKPIIPRQAKSIRIHASGDFFSQAYFDMWLEIARENLSVEFWAYTKSIRYWVARLGQIPENLVLTASYGGREDHLIKEHGLKNVIIVPTEMFAIDRPIDTNDDWARKPNVNFYLIDNFK
jgi:hypothetical protein